MNKDRRSFLKQAGTTALGVGCGFSILGTGCSSQHGSHGGEISEHQLAMIIDVELCNEDVRRACWEACHNTHNVPFIPDPEKTDPEQGNPHDIDPREGIRWIWEENHENVFPDQVHAAARAALQENPLPTLVLCNHCTSPSCTRVCPTKATWKRESDGIVMMDMHRCIGCRYCMVACPYGARSFNWRDPRQRDPETGELLYFADNELPSATFPARSKGVVEKCNFCADQLRFGKQPSCVVAAEEVVPGALTFGRHGDQKIKDKLKTNRTICRRISLGTGPNVFYIV